MTQHGNDMSQPTPSVFAQHLQDYAKVNFYSLPSSDLSFSTEDVINAELAFRLQHARHRQNDRRSFATPTAASQSTGKPVISGHMTSDGRILESLPRDRFLEPVIPHQPSVKAQSSAQEEAFHTLKDIVFNGASDASKAHRRGRTGPQTPHSRTRTKSVKDAGGACWRCKFVGKACDGEDPCKSCPQKATSWQALGCRRGTLSDVLPQVVLCPQAGIQSAKTPSTTNTEKDEGLAAFMNENLLQHINQRDQLIAEIESTQGTPSMENDGQCFGKAFREITATLGMPSNLNGSASGALARDAPRTRLLRHTAMIIIWELERNGSASERILIDMPTSSENPASSFSKLVSCAACYQLDAANDRLIEASLFCLQACLEAIRCEELELRSFSHASCESSLCKVDAFAKLNTCLRGYFELLSKAIFKKNAKLRKDWWLSVFYSLCIQSFVRQALIVFVSCIGKVVDVDQASAASEHLHLAVQLFFVTCNAAAKGYDPLSYDYENLAPAEVSALTHHYLRPEDAKLAQIAVQKDSWQDAGIESAYDYLGLLFDMDRAIFVPPTARPPLYGYATVSRPLLGDTEGVVDEATGPATKKRRLDKRDEEGYTSDESIATQIPDTHIIHPGSLALLDASAELPPPSISDDDDFIIREHEARFEGDMFTPRWIRDFEFGPRGAEGWCGFCSRWLKLGDAWFNDRCLFHGICPELGRGFLEPKEPVRIHPLKQIWEAGCEKCRVQVRYRKGEKRCYSAWYMHAANCGDESLPRDIRADEDEEVDGDEADVIMLQEERHNLVSRS